MYIGEIIKNYRIKNKMSQRAFASKTNLSPSYINTLEKIYNPKTGKPYSVTTDVAMQLAYGMDLKIEELLKMLSGDQEFIINSDEDEIEEDDTKQVFPLLGVVKAGYDYLASENIIGYVSADTHVSDIENCYALKVTGDSMEPILYEDDIVIVHKQNDVDNGQVAIILIDEEEATIKKVVKYKDYISLIAFNSYYPPKKLTKSDNFKIIGKVIEARISKIFE